MDYVRVAVGEAEYLAAIAGSGPPVLLLHGFPQTHHCWRYVAPALGERHTVVAADIRGYGGTSAPAGGPKGEGYTKREMGNDLFDLMAALGHPQFAIVGHDRGGRVAYRMALDRPDRVERVAVLNIVPTIDQFERMGTGPSLGYWPWFLLAQPAPFPEGLIAAAPEHFLRFIFDAWCERREAIDPAAFDAYLAALDEPTIAVDVRRLPGELLARPGRRRRRPAGGPPYRVPAARADGRCRDPARGRRGGVGSMGPGRPGGDAARRPLHPGGGRRAAGRRPERVPGAS